VANLWGKKNSGFSGHFDTLKQLLSFCRKLLPLLEKITVPTDHIYTYIYIYIYIYLQGHHWHCNENILSVHCSQICSTILKDSQSCPHI
jgi:hypothetical protein